MWNKLGWLNWFWRFLCEGFSSFNLKRFCYSSIWSCSLCEWRTSFCTGLISRKLYWYLCFQLALLIHSVSYFIFLYRSPSLLLCFIFYSILSNVNEVLLINSPANVFDFRDINIHHKDCLTYSGGTDRPGKPCYNFSVTNDLPQIVKFPTLILDCDFHSPALLDSFISSESNICFTIAFPPLGNSDHVVVSVVTSILVLIGMVFVIIWEMFNERISLNSEASAAAIEFCEWVLVGMDVYIPHRKYQVKLNSSPWFSVACAAAIVHRNPFFFIFTNRIILVNLK